jgi:hypothetical protein
MLVLFRNTKARRERARQARLLTATLWFATLGASPASGQSYGDITFFVASDLHYGHTNGTTSSADVCRATLASMNALPGQGYPVAAGGGTVDNPRGVLLIGDLTDSGATATDWAAVTNDWGLNGEQRLSWPVYEGFGNHDCDITTVVPNGIKARNPYRRSVSNISTNGYHYSWDWDFLHLVCLNLFPGNSPDTYNRSPRDSLAFLADDLARTVGNTGRPVILYHHYGFDSFSLGVWSNQQRSDYLSIITNYNVIAIFAGHNHLVDYVPVCGLNTFNDGTAGEVLGAGYVINYLVVHVTQTNLVVAERRPAGSWGAVFNFPIVTDNSPHIVGNPDSATAAMGSAVALAVQAVGPNLNYQWFLNATNPVAGATNNVLALGNVRFSESGAYNALVTNPFGAAMSKPATLAVTASVSVRPAFAIALSGNPGDALKVEYSDTLVPAPVWQPLATVTMSNTTQIFVDATAPAAPQRFYRSAAPPTRLSALQVPTVTVVGDAGDVLQLQYSDTPDPGANWVPLTTLTLSDSSNLFLDISAPSLARCYRAVASP